MGRALRRDEVELLDDVRTLLRRALLNWAAGRPTGRADLLRLDAVLAAAPMKRRLGSPGQRTRLLPVRRDGHWIAAEMVDSALELMSDGDVRRLKVCRNESCSWMFYDDSVNRSRRWCDPDVCGNLVTVRRFRKRVVERERATPV